MVFSATFNIISVISGRSVLLVEETGVQEKITELSQVTGKLMITSKEWEICQVLDATKSMWWAFLILFQELNVAMVIKEFNILMLKSPLNQER